MSTGVAIAIATSGLAFLAACFTVWVTAPLRRLEFDKLTDELQKCRDDRRLLRGRLELLQQALLGLLPASHRDALLLALDTMTPPFASEYEPDHGRAA